VWHLPCTTLVRKMPDDTVLDMKLDERCAVIALTHDPKLDDLALMEAVRTPAFYVGALGSRRNNAARRERLETHFNLTEDQLSRLRGPIGIYIGSRTPPEIAVSILAEVTAVRNGVALPGEFRIEDATTRLDVAVNEQTNALLPRVTDSDNSSICAAIAARCRSRTASRMGTAKRFGQRLKLIQIKY
jgi:xanthine dehydrogenase accessory factor